MAFGTRFYVPRMERAENETLVGYFANKAHVAFDYNPDTYEIGLASYVQIRFDMDATLSGTTLTESVTWAGIWLKNYTASGLSAANVRVYSTIDSSYSTPSLITRCYLYGSWLSGTSGLIAIDMGAVTDRYWLFEFNAFPSAPQVSMVMLGTYFDVPRRWDWGHTRGRRQMNIINDMPDGRTLSRNQRSEGPETFIRSYEYLDQTSRDLLVNAHAAALGRHVPVIIVDDSATAMSAHRLVRFATDELDQQEVEYQLHNVSVPMIEVPYTRAGRAF